MDQVIPEITVLSNVMRNLPHRSFCNLKKIIANYIEIDKILK